MVVLLGLGAAVLLAVGFVLQQHEAAQLHGTSLRPGVLLVLARSPVWLAGIAAMVAGQLLGATALGVGSLIVVAPLLATSVLFALPLGALASHRRLSRADWVGAGTTVVGLSLLLVISDPERSGQEVDVAVPDIITAGTVIAVLVALLLTVSRHRSPPVRALLVAACAGTVFGLQDFLTQQTFEVLDRGIGALVAAWQPWVLLVVAVVGLTLSQNAFSTADLTASLPALTIAEPVCAMVLAATLLDEGLRTQPGPLAAGVTGLALMVVGVVLLARSPLVADPHGRAGRGAGAP